MRCRCGYAFSSSFDPATRIRADIESERVGAKNIYIGVVVCTVGIVAAIVGWFLIEMTAVAAGEFYWPFTLPVAFGAVSLIWGGMRVFRGMRQRWRRA